jgi:hypothetical protein
VSHGPSPMETLLASGALVAMLAMVAYTGAGVMRARGEDDKVRGWLLRVWLQGALLWVLIAATLRCWNGDFWITLAAVRSGEGDMVTFTIGMVCAVGTIVTLFRLVLTWREAGADGYPLSLESPAEEPDDKTEPAEEANRSPVGEPCDEEERN